MNIVCIINTEKWQDIPHALKQFADCVEKDMRIQGRRANAIGTFYSPPANYDYQIQNTDHKSLADFIDSMK